MRERHIGLLGGLVTIVTAGLITVGPASAGTLEVTCSGGTVFSGGTQITSTNGDIKLVGEGWCSLPVGQTVNGDVQLTEKAQLAVNGTINGDVKANSDLNVTVPIPPLGFPTFPNMAVVVRPTGLVNGDVIQDGKGGIRAIGMVLRELDPIPWTV